MIKLFEEFSKEPEVMINYYDNGQKRSEYWFFNNKLHREDGPAYQQWCEDGHQKEIERWFLNGELHREDGPAFQIWHNNGKKYVEKWYLNDKEYSRKEWIKKLKDIGSKHYREQKMLYDAEKYNL